jgi:hypothetical protein
LSDDWLLADEFVTTSAPGDANLVAYYKFEGDAKDSSGKAHHGSMIGNPAFAAGKIGQAITFDGAGDKVEVPATAAGNPDLYPTDAVSASAWIKTTMAATGNHSVIRHDYHFTALQTTSATGAWSAVFTNDAGARSGVRTAAFDWTMLNDGEWHHYAATYNLGLHEVWIDGVRVASADHGSRSLWTGDDLPWVFGGRETSAGGAEDFTGALDEVHIFNRALSAAEIAYLADETPGDGKLYFTVQSVAELYSGEPQGSRKINLKDFAALANAWLEKTLWP